MQSVKSYWNNNVPFLTEYSKAKMSVMYGKDENGS